MVLAIYQIILHLNKITECLKITTFKIVFTFDVFVSAETTMHCKVTCILYKKQAHFSQLFCLQVRSVTPSHFRIIYSFPSRISPLFLLNTKTDDAILPDNREYIKNTRMALKTILCTKKYLTSHSLINV
jgi:hypothetical protein